MPPRTRHFTRKINVNPIRNRIKEHRRVRAGDLVPHEMNPRRHPADQRRALADLYASIGFARSLLAYELPDGRLKLIDGHLRREMEPDMLADLEVLDVNDDEARVLLLSIDPLAQLAEYDQPALDRLRDRTPTQSDALHNLWQAIAAGNAATRTTLEEARRRPTDEIPERFLVLIECEDEAQQVRLLQRFQAEGLRCQAKIS
jgi:hypothetical protein